MHQLSSGAPLSTFLELVESQEYVLPLADEDAARLRQIGQRLASKADWWGSSDEEPPPERSVIEVRFAERGLWGVRVRDAVGVIVLGFVQLHVIPKIPEKHFVYLASRSNRLPRTSDGAGASAVGPLWQLVLLWFLDAAEQLMRRGLIRDYADMRDTLPTIRGQVSVLSAARRVLHRNPVFDCAFEDHVEDNPPNRLVRAAAAHVAAAPLPEPVRQRARRLLVRFNAVSSPSVLDERWQVDRRTAHYRVPITLAHHVLRSVGRSLATGTDLAWTFLIRTPELVEDGIGSDTTGRIRPKRCHKKGTQAGGIIVNPESQSTVLGHSCRRGHQYKVSRNDWNRADLYQVLAFAAALRCFDAAILNFTPETEAALPSLTVGDHRVSQLSWPCGMSILAWRLFRSLMTFGSGSRSCEYADSGRTEEPWSSSGTRSGAFSRRQVTRPCAAADLSIAASRAQGLSVLHGRSGPSTPMGTSKWPARSNPVPLALLGQRVHVRWDTHVVRVFQSDTHARVAAGVFAPREASAPFV